MTIPPPERRSLTEQEAHRVLARAVELDVREIADVSPDQLRAIAIEAGITPDALEAALDEFDAERPTRGGARSKGPTLADRLTRFRRPAFLAIVAGVAAFTPGDVVVTNVLYVVPLCALYELVRLTARGRAGPSGRDPAAAGAGATAKRPSSEKEKSHIRSLILRPTAVSPAI